MAPLSTCAASVASSGHVYTTRARDPCRDTFSTWPYESKRGSSAVCATAGGRSEMCSARSPSLSNAAVGAAPSGDGPGAVGAGAGAPAGPPLPARAPPWSEWLRSRMPPRPMPGTRSEAGPAPGAACRCRSCSRRRPSGPLSAATVPARSRPAPGARESGGVDDDSTLSGPDSRTAWGGSAGATLTSGMGASGMGAVGPALVARGRCAPIGCPWNESETLSVRCRSAAGGGVRSDASVLARSRRRMVRRIAERDGGLGRVSDRPR